MRTSLPDPDISLRDASDFIFDSRLGRSALKCSTVSEFPVFLRDFIEEVYRLTLSCHLPEFTDHGLPHLCRVVHRISQWSCPPAQGDSEFLCDLLDESDLQPAVLLLAVLFHDVGMLSQRSEDLSPEDRIRFAKGQRELANWVRTTHIPRLSNLITRLVGGIGYEALRGHPVIQRALAIAKAHGSWPWENEFLELSRRDPGLAAILAVADLLDEDANRCDTDTLVSHRQGTMLNVAHWIRHSLTEDRILVRGGVVNVRMVRPPHTDSQMTPVFSALRNHFRLILLYQQELALVGAGIVSLTFEPMTGCPLHESRTLESWYRIRGINSELAFVFHLLTTFFP